MSTMLVDPRQLLRDEKKSAYLSIGESAVTTSKTGGTTSLLRKLLFWWIGLTVTLTLSLTSFFVIRALLSQESDSTSLPPAPPGYAWSEVVQYTLTAEGEPQDFNRTLYRVVLSNSLIGVQHGEMQINVTAGSTVVETYISTISTSSVIDALSKLTITYLSQQLGIKVESIQVPEVTMTLKSTAPPECVAAPDGIYYVVRTYDTCGDNIVPNADSCKEFALREGK